MKRWGKRLWMPLFVCVLLVCLPVTAQAAGVEYYGRDMLAEMDNADALLYAYDAIAAGVEESTAKIKVYDGTNALTVDEMVTVMEAYTGDYAHHFWLGNRYSYTHDGRTVHELVPQYILSGDALTQARATFDAEVERILSGIRTDMSTFEKELYLHDTLAEKVTYTEATHAHNAYGAMIDGMAVCEGYAEAFQTLLHRAGIESYITTGHSQGVGHAWNLVKIDGEYYYVDLTWDDQDSELYHAYFNVTTAQLQEDHTIGGTIPVPVCDAEDAHYFTVRGGRVDAFDAQTIGQMLNRTGRTVHLYASGMTAAELKNTLWNSISGILQAADIDGAVSVSRSSLGREVILRVISNGVTAEMFRWNKGALEVVVIDRLGDTRLTDLYVAAYDADGRMLGLECAAGSALSADGTHHSVTFEGEAAFVRVFAVDASGIPLDDAFVMCVE